MLHLPPSRTSLTALLSEITSTTNSITKTLGLLGQRANHERIITKEANSTFLRAAKELQPLLDGFKDLTTTQLSAPTSIDNAATSDTSSNAASVLTFQTTKDALTSLQDITNDWIQAHDTGRFHSAAPLQEISSNTTQNAQNMKLSKKKRYQVEQARKLILGDKRHVKHVVGLVKSLQYRVYEVTPGYMRSLVWPTNGSRDARKDILDDGENGLDGRYGEESDLEGAVVDEAYGQLELIDTATRTSEMDAGVSADEVMLERCLVRGMESLRLWTEELEQEIERDALLDDVDFGAMFEM